jgi:ribosomal protein S18 acetylase RimI-like enzyme
MAADLVSDLDFTIRRLGSGDTEWLHQITMEDADFDLGERGGEKSPLQPADADAYLGDPSVLHWVAYAGDRVLGHLHCQVIRKHAGDPIEVLLYEIGIRAHARRRGIGRALLSEMVTWMNAHEAAEVWVLADNPGAIAFYESLGFEVPPGLAVYLTRALR